VLWRVASRLLKAWWAARLDGLQGHVPWSGGIEGIVVNLSDDARAWSLGSDELGGCPPHLLGLAGSSPVWVSLAIDPSDR